MTSPSLRAQAGVPPHQTVPVLLEAGSHPLRLGEALCLRGRCVAQIPPGRYTLERISLTSEAMKVEYSEAVTVEGPTRLGVSGPGFLHDAAFGFVVGGGLVAAAGLLLPLFICQSSRSVDSNGQVIGGSVCDRASDGVKVAWIAGAGAGLTLAMVGAVTLLAAPSVSHATVAPWDYPPRSTALGLLPLVVPTTSPRDAKLGAALGLAFSATF